MTKKSKPEPTTIEELLPEDVSPMFHFPRYSPNFNEFEEWAKKHNIPLEIGEPDNEILFSRETVIPVTARIKGEGNDNKNDISLTYSFLKSINPEESKTYGYAIDVKARIGTMVGSGAYSLDGSRPIGIRNTELWTNEIIQNKLPDNSPTYDHIREFFELNKDNGWEIKSDGLTFGEARQLFSKENLDNPERFEGMTAKDKMDWIKNKTAKEVTLTSPNGDSINFSFLEDEPSRPAKDIEIKSSNGSTIALGQYDSKGSNYDSNYYLTPEIKGDIQRDLKSIIKGKAETNNYTPPKAK